MLPLFQDGMEAGSQLYAPAALPQASHPLRPRSVVARKSLYRESNTSLACSVVTTVTELSQSLPLSLLCVAQWRFQ
jgi:hypothetical protein